MNLTEKFLKNFFHAKFKIKFTNEQVHYPLRCPFYVVFCSVILRIKFFNHNKRKRRSVKESAIEGE